MTQIVELNCLMNLGEEILDIELNISIERYDVHSQQRIRGRVKLTAAGCSD